MYKSFDETDFKKFGKVYNYKNRSAGYYKHNLTDNAHPESRTWLTKMARLYRSKGTAAEYMHQSFRVCIVQVILLEVVVLLYCMFFSLIVLFHSFVFDFAVVVLKW